MEAWDPFNHTHDPILPPFRVELTHLGSADNHSVHIIREDFSSFGVAGGKRRKFASLVPFWKKAGVQRVYVIGGSQSNQLLAASQILTQYDIDFRLVAKKSHHRGPGNFFFTRILASEEKWIFIEF